MGNSSTKFPITKIQDTNKFQFPITNLQTGFRFGHWNLVIGYYLVIVSWLLVICLGCGDIESQLASIIVSPSSATIGVNKTQLFTVTGKNSVGQIVSVTPTWSVEGNIGTISSSGLFTAGSIEGTGNVAATANSFSAKAAVTVTAKGWIQGTIFDSKGNKVQGLKVYLKGYESTLSDFTRSVSPVGFYSISNVPAGTYEVWTLETDAYRAASKEATVGSGETVTKNITILYFTDPPDFTPPEYTP